MQRTRQVDCSIQTAKKRVRYDPEDQPTQPTEGKLETFIKNSKMIEILKKKGVKSLFPVQYQTYQTIYQGKDLMVRDKTGSGKTLAFALPVIERMRKQRVFEKNHLAKFLIVLPTRQLALQVKDQIESLRLRDEADFRVVAVYGKSDIQRQISTISRGIDIIVGTPGRLIDLLQRDVIKMNELQVLCLDEADEMLKQGFKEDIEKIYKYITDNTSKKTQNLLFSATIPQWLHQLSHIYQDKDRKFINLIKEESFITPKTLVHMCVRLGKNDEAFMAKMVNNLLKKYAIKSGNSIIFCERKADVTRLSSSLNDIYNVKNEPLHSDVPQFKRQKAYHNFKQGSLKCIIATNVAARGLDFPEIDIVIQTQPPKNVEPYIHRSGRTARKGRDGICVTLYNDSTERLIKNIEREAKIRMTRLSTDDFLQKSNQYQSKKRNYDDQDEEYELYVQYLPQNKSDYEVREYFEQKRIKVKSIKLLKDSQGKSKGCGFLKFTSKDQRNKCLDLDGEKFQENRISLSHPNKR